ncbi:Cytochrome P450 monooxygenase ABA1 [Cladobotryum mycophilum]|uniref:Cytochrome P450 monooxygenase ABA1 n=1 Tax=Cladobotryum mycophilum TaxID=491253 RepID=A0ABR0SC92_9HYPO
MALFPSSSLAYLPDWQTGAAIALLLTAVLTSFVASRLRWYYHLHEYDGPFMAKISPWWLVRTVASGRAYLDFWEVTQKYGSIARIGPNDLLTSEPDLMKHMYKARSDYTRSSWYEGMRFDPSRDNLLSLRNEDDHRELRSKMAAGYSGREVDDLEETIDHNILEFSRLLGKYADKNKPVDFGRKAQYFTLDVISHVAFGEPFGFLETDSDVYKYIETTEKTLPMVMVTTVIPWLLKLLSSPLFKRFLPSAKDALGFGKVMSIAKEVAAERFGEDKKVQKDMLGSFVAHGLTQSETESEILLQIVAGSDTTATAIRSTMLHVVTTPRVLTRLREEIISSRISRPVITNDEAQEMPYLQAVIKEGLRIFPPVAGLMAKEVPPEGDHWNGRFLPGGTRIGICAWGIFRREDIWGTDAKEFRPERWLENSPEKVQTMEGILELIFSYGRWQCLGRPVALIELNKIFVQLLQEFDFSVCDPTKPWNVFNCGIFSQTDFMVRVERRTV